MTSIAEPASDVKAAASGQLPADVLAVFAADQAALVAGGIPAQAVTVGDHIDSFTPPDATGQLRTLEELTADGPAVIVFYRGGWRPYCNLALRACEQDLLPELSAFVGTTGRRITRDSRRVAQHAGTERAELS